jgi:hypothetical protein
MRTYGIDSQTGNWTVLTESVITGSSNPQKFSYTDSVGTVFTITSTLYNANTTFLVGSTTINTGDVIQNDVIVNNLGETVSNIWTDITLNTILSSAPLSENIAQQIGGVQSFFNNYGLTQGEEVIVSAGYIWLATLVQTLRLSTNESPYYANYGIPAQTSVNTQIPPDIALNTIQQQYAPYFKSLTILRQQNTTNPTYNIRAVFLDGTTIQSVVAT